MKSSKILARLIFSLKKMRQSRFSMKHVIVFYLIFGFFIYRHLLLDPAIWNYGDTMFPSTEESLNNHRDLISHAWGDHEFLGYDTTGEGIARSSYVALLNFFYFFTKDFSVSQFFWWVLIFAVSGVSMYKLTHYLFKGRMIAFAASLFYALNPWVIDRVTHMLICQAYAFIPLLFVFYILLLDTKRLKYAIYFSFAAFFVIPSYHYTFMTAMLLLAYFFYRLVTEREWDARKSYISNSLKLTGCTIAFLGFFSFPLFLSLTEGGGAFVTGIRFSSAGPGLFWGQSCTVLNVIRLLGFHDSFFKGSVLGATMSTDAPIGWGWFSLLIPLLWTFPLLFELNTKELKKTEFFFYFLILIGILLSTSTTLLNGSLFEYLRFLPSSNDPNYYVFILAFAGAPLSGIGVCIIVEKIQLLLNRKLPRISRRKLELKVIGIILMVLTVCLISYPIVFWKDFRYGQIQYPLEYIQAADFLNRPYEDFRILLLPPHSTVKHMWAPYSWISSSDGYLLNKPFFGRWAPEFMQQSSVRFSISTIKKLLANSSDLVKTLQFANVKYIVLMKDVENQPPYATLEPGEMEGYVNTLDSQENIHLVKRFGDIFVYELDDEHFLPRIYSAKTKSANEVLRVGDETEPKITFEKINPTKYLVHVRATEPFYLVFSESYHPQWRLYINKEGEQTSWIEALFQKPISDDKHFLVNGYANAWYVDPEQLGIRDEEFSITLLYWPQSLYYLGCITSVIVFVGYIGYLVWDWKRMRKESPARCSRSKFREKIANLVSDGIRDLNSVSIVKFDGNIVKSLGKVVSPVGEEEMST